MRIAAAISCSIVLAMPLIGAADEPAATEVVASPREGRVLIADSNSLSFRKSQAEGLKLLSDLDREDAETIMRINATRGTWQSYLLYTSPEMKVPGSYPGFTFTLPPPSRVELERRRRSMAAAAKASAARAPQPVVETQPPR